MDNTINISKYRTSKMLDFRKLLVVVYLEFRAVSGRKGDFIAKLTNPMVYLLFFAVGIKSLIGKEVTYNGLNVQYLDYVVPGLICIFMTNFLSHSLFRAIIDKQWGLLGLKLLNGVSPLTYILGMSIYPFVVFTLQSTIIILLSFIMFLVKYSIKTILIAYVLSYIAILFWTSLGIVLAMIVKNYHQRDLLISIIILPITFTAPIFYSLDNVPLYVNIISKINPLTYFVELIRSILLRKPNMLILSIALIITCFLVNIAIYAIRKTEMKSQSF
ncbi:ABC-2 type transport system permease protein [Caloranaerobacter azorensis DSM 13643]|uniref:Transport permease protein n=1 Tax=Caloranaerobacter azorensis DSM 13643 TaxID=1121264 RepID=A0A1M5QZJ3_9FIRM|nr:ABC transporter permease [Caloranaerobacter azorensis]SHH19545.1 ABC-2 type transport system permease protein [Caloranaerobacter azorensis DSM 13643]